MTDRTSGPFEYPDEAGYPDGTGTLTQTQRELVEEVKGANDLGPGISFFLINNEASHVYDAVSGDTRVGGITYARQKDVVTLISTSVYPEFRNQGVATELIRRVLDDIRANGWTVKIECPIVDTFIQKHQEYQSLVDER